MSAEQPDSTSESYEQQQPPFGNRFLWDVEGSVVAVAADRSFGSTLRRIRDEHARWVVVVRAEAGSAASHYYAFRSSELERLAEVCPDRESWTIGRAVETHEWTSSMTSRSGRPIWASVGRSGPAATRIIDFDAVGRIVAIGERKEMDPTGKLEDLDHPDFFDYSLDLGPTRGIREPWRSAAATEIEVTLSAEIKGEIKVGDSEKANFRIELSSEALPLGASRAALAKVDLAIVVSLIAENDVIEIVEGREREVDPPTSKQPQTGAFLVKGIHTGVSRLAVTFHQGGTDLGIIGLAVEVVEAAPRSERVYSNSAPAAPRDLLDDDKLALIVEQRAENGEVFYQYILHSEALGLPYRKLRSKALLDRGGGPAATILAFVERIYDRVTRELPTWGDLLRREIQELQREVRALGASLCDELLDPEVAKLLWPLRARITTIQIVSWEPYIPWELVRLRDPVSREIDDRFLAEYGLVRTLSDEMPPKELPMANWGYLGATFPTGQPSVGGSRAGILHRHDRGKPARTRYPTACNPRHAGRFLRCTGGPRL